jgi:hypothetical protein
MSTGLASETVTPTAQFGKTDNFQETGIVKQPGTATATPIAIVEILKLKCIPECDQLFDMEVSILAAQQNCQIQEVSNKDCMQILWCIACRA